MNPRALIALLVSAVVALGALVVLTFAQAASVDGERTADGILSPGSPYRGAARDGGRIPPRSPDFRLRDQDGRVRTLQQFRGRPVIVTFLFTSCEDTCPAMARQVASALDTLGADVPTLVVSVDPDGDTPEAAQQFLNKMDLRGRADFLLGTRAQLVPIWKAYGIQPQGRAFDHSAYVLVLDARGRQRVAWPADKLTSDGLAHDVAVVRRLTTAR
ncbi:SCO family protein [Patulibacter sp. NPDC049589]|uniref:SCO family protein n=1 Tax=Patulibacter sp. NPDC049589 TaxID=3154731 RepID=UPI0034476D71